MPPFKVIIGGGPNGITAAHTLHHAGIDFVLLERRQDVFEDTGASLVLSPQNLRIFHQLGILDHFLHLGAPFLHLSQSFNPKSGSFRRTHALSRIKENHGSALVIFHRAVLLKALYDGLPEQAKKRYLVSKKVADIKLSDTGVEVVCEDGSSHSGNIVIGADGVHSKTRSVVRSLTRKAAELSHGQAKDSLHDSGEPEASFVASYKCLWGSFKRETEVGDSYEVQGHHRSAMYLTGKDKAWIFLYEKLPQPTAEPTFYDKDATAAFAQSFAHWKVHEKLKIGDIISRPTFVPGMNNIQEGIAQQKSWAGRIVLVGDACHRFTPNAGLGFNSGIQDVVSLSNHLRALLQKTETPDDESLQKAFQAYQEERRAPLTNDYCSAAQSTRLQAWATWKDYLLARWVYPFEFVKNYLTDHWTAAGIKGGLVLDYLPAVEPLIGKVPWDYPLRELSEASGQNNI